MMKPLTGINKLFGAAVIGALSFMPGLTGDFAKAQDMVAKADTSAVTPVSLPQKGPALERQMTALEKGDAAQNYSINNDGVGVFINLAKDPEFPPEQLIRAIKANFVQQGIDIDLHTNNSNGDLTTVTFFVDGVPFADEDGNGNGYTLSKVEAGFNRVVSAFKQHHAKVPLQEPPASVIR